MKFEDIKLAYGFPLQIQTTGVTGQPERYSCRLIGCLPGRSILLSVPKAAGKLVRFRVGQKIVTRLMVDNGIVVFATLVETQTLDPYPILHVAYPEVVSFKGIRGATRVVVEKPVTVMNLTHPEIEAMSGLMVDISISGGRIELHHSVGEIGNTIQLDMEVKVGNISRILSLEAIIRSRVEPDQKSDYSHETMVYGLQFVETNEDRLLLLYAYVYTQIGSEDNLT